MRAIRTKCFRHRSRFYRALLYPGGGIVLKRRDPDMWIVVVRPAVGLQCAAARAVYWGITHG